MKAADGMSQQAGPKLFFEFIAGNLCLDFTNTVNNRAGDQPEELLIDYSRLLRWAEEARVITSKTAESLRIAGQESPGRARSTLRDAIALRDALYDVFAAVARQRTAPETQLAVLNTAVHDAFEHAQIVYGNRQFTWEWVRAEHSLDSMLWPVARAAMDLLTSEELNYVRLCAAESCAWLFLDTTKNHRRRWCEMKTCGNRAKAKTYYERQKAE
jgi:predicted RNA-binding Zn ribbon-like protein